MHLPCPIVIVVIGSTQPHSLMEHRSGQVLIRPHPEKLTWITTYQLILAKGTWLSDNPLLSHTRSKSGKKSLIPKFLFGTSINTKARSARAAITFCPEGLILALKKEY